ncbi:hypothetical protein L950_0207655 [Sphingobacterium sp. IITKGP-BTPF85]|nr:hypothetical protein L950_0207655 [Sphingobacterium sp. IITKGP-BTPF85]
MSKSFLIKKKNTIDSVSKINNKPYNNEQF